MAGENAKSVKRSLYYYDFLWKVYNESEGKYVNVKAPKKKLKNFLETFHEKDIEPKNILTTENEDSLFIITDNVNDESIEFRLVLSKNNGLPLVEENGKLEDLENYIDKNQNIAEITHCIFFLKTGIIGAEFNFNGARLSALSWYIPRVLCIPAEQVTLYSIKFLPKINGDAYQKLDNDDTFTLFEIAFKPDSEAYTKILSKKSAFKGPVSDTPDADVIKVCMQKRKNKKNDHTGMNDILTKEDMKRIIKYHRDDVSRLYMSKGTYSDGVDLLADKLVAKVDIIRTKRRTVSSKDAYKKIRNFYEEEVKPSK